MNLDHRPGPHKPIRRSSPAERLDALRFQAFIVRCQLAKAADDEQRALLDFRLGIADARAADLRARLIEGRAA